MEPTENIVNYKFGIFYFNKSDSRTIVPKKNKMLGWTFNFARYTSYFYIILIAACIWVLPYLLIYLNIIK